MLLLEIIIAKCCQHVSFSSITLPILSFSLHSLLTFSSLFVSCLPSQHLFSYLLHLSLSETVLCFQSSCVKSGTQLFSPIQNSTYLITKLHSVMKKQKSLQVLWEATTPSLSLLSQLFNDDFLIGYFIFSQLWRCIKDCIPQ